MKKEIPDDYVRMQKCIHCGKDTGAILLNKRLKSIPEEQVYSDFCPECKKLFKSHVFFTCATCNKAGFIKRTVLKKIVKPEFYKATQNRVGFEKCPSCMGWVKDK